MTHQQKRLRQLSDKNLARQLKDVTKKAVVPENSDCDPLDDPPLTIADLVNEACRRLRQRRHDRKIKGGVK